MSHNLDLTYDQLRSVVLQALRESPSSQFANFYEPVANLAAKMKGETSGAANTIGMRHVSSGFLIGERDLSGYDRGRVQDILFDLFVEGIARPGLGDGSNNGPPWFHVTEWGKKVIEGGPGVPYDPEGYLARLHADLPGLDAVIVIYLTEALHTFRIGCLLASTVAIGCASEKMLLLVIDAYASRLPQPRQDKFRKDVDGRMIKRQFEELTKHLDSAVKPKLPGNIRDDLDVHLAGIFSMIRRMRNDAGHPTGTMITREEAHANLTVFPVYLKHAHELIAWLKAATL